MLNLPNKIYIVGFMGVGKTTFGKHLANLLHYKAIDTDFFIEQKMRLTVSQIFEIHGESFFRKLEKKTLKKLAQSKEQLVISTGGGIGANAYNMALMKRTGKVILLDFNLQTIIKRLKLDKLKRPILANLEGKELENKVKELHATRKNEYKKAHIVLSEKEAVKLKKWDALALFC